jgi:glyoxylase-like metal-dependent hydrolase (beta-lactamase superfamily II)
VTPEQYQVLIVRYGTRSTLRSEVFLNYGIYQEPDHQSRLDYFFWIIRSEAGVVAVIDTGFSSSAGEARGRLTLIEPKKALRELDIDPASVPLVVITHAHYDHIGNLDLFENANVVMSASEYSFWTSPVSKRTQFAHFVEDEEIETLARTSREGRLRLFEKVCEVAKDVIVLRVGGHTVGQSILTIPTSRGRVLLASDAVHLYEEIGRDMPFMAVTDLAAMYEGFDMISQELADGRTILLTGHDPSTLERFPRLPGDIGQHVAYIGEIVDKDPV